MTITHVNIRKGQVLSPSDIARLVDRAKKGDLFAFYGGHNLDPVEAHQYYQDAHDGISPETVIWGAKNNSGKLDMDTFDTHELRRLKKAYDRKFEAKALTSISAAVFIPVLIAPGVIDIVAKKMPFYAMIQKKAMTSSTMRINRRATDQIDNIDYDTDTGDVLTPIDQAYTKIDIEAKLLFVAGQVTHFAQHATQESLDLYAKEIEDHFVDMQGFKEKAIILGEVTADGTWAAHFTVANGDNGIVKKIEGTLSGANYVNLAGTASVNVSHVEKIIENIYANNGECSALICDRSTFTRLRNLAKDFKRYEAMDINLGFPDQRFMFDGVPVFPSNFMPRTAGQKAVFGFDIGAIEYRELLPDTLFEVAQDLSPSRKFFFEHFGTFVVTAPEQCSTAVNGA